MKTKTLLTLVFGIVTTFAMAQTDVTTSKENVPVKKESFTSKLERYKSEGFKVAVVLVSGPIKTKMVAPSSTTGAVKNMTLDGELPAMDKDLAPLVGSFAGAMNDAFNTDVFEIVDESKMPKKDSKWGEVTDWGSTIYKMVVTYSAIPEYDYTASGGKYEATLTVNLNIVATEFVNEKKGVKMQYPIRAGNLGLYKSAAFKSDTDPGFKTIDELNAAVNPPTGADLVAELQKEQDSKIGDLIEKQKK